MSYLWKKNLKKFANDKNYRRVGDHCHFTGKCRSAAHSICNLRFNVTNEISVVFIMSEGQMNVLRKIQKNTKLFLS